MNWNISTKLPSFQYLAHLALTEAVDLNNCPFLCWFAKCIQYERRKTNSAYLTKLTLQDHLWFKAFLAFYWILTLQIFASIRDSAVPNCFTKSINPTSIYFTSLFCENIKKNLEWMSRVLEIHTTVILTTLFDTVKPTKYQRVEILLMKKKRSNQPLTALN